MTRRIGVCSWSLRAADPRELADRVAAVGVTSTQLALEPLRTKRWSIDETIGALAARGITIASAMMQTHGEDYSTLASIAATGGLRPDATWAANEAAAREDAQLARALGVSLVTFHAGFLPHDPRDPERAKILDRIRRVADLFAATGVRVGLETGQESAETLAGVLDALAHDNVGVNFDPANMILYGMGDPVLALARLAPHVMQIHVKDARASARPGEWGTEVVVGTGDVDWEGFDAARRERALDVDLMIEREAGDSRVADARRARALIESLVA